MAKSNYLGWSKEELIRRIEALEKRKKYGLVWDEERTREKFEAEAEGRLPVLKKVESLSISGNPEMPTHILIEGDNYHALAVLSYTHEKSIDLIYIDPPFNTGSKSWKYNNSYVEKDDAFWHSKWLSFMEKRLKLSKKLLRKDGSIIVAIDDYEVNHLGILLEELFPNFERDLIVVIHHPQGAGSDTISRVHEYAYICTPKGVGLKGRKTSNDEDKWSLKRSGQGENNWRINRPKQFFAILVDDKNRKVIGVGPEIPIDKQDYPRGRTRDGFLRIYPIDREGKERVWRYNRQTMQDNINADIIEYTVKNSLVIKKQGVNAIPVFSVWQGAKYNAGTNGSSLLTEIMGTANTFPYPKSLYTITDMLSIIVGNNPEAIILDFFAGSGTTGHAVLELNHDDGGSRQFILCTNNENNICSEVCLPRIERIMKGYINSKKLKTKGYGGSLKYFKTDFVPAEQTDKNKELLTKKAVEMLCLRENTFNSVIETEEYKIFKNEIRYTAIIFDQLSIAKFNKYISKLDCLVSVYIFSLGDDDFSQEFKEVKNKIKVCAIPEAILRVYRRIFK